MKVAKNKLAKLALKDTEVEAISDLLKGQTCVAYSEDPVSAARVSVSTPRRTTSSSSSAARWARPGSTATG